MIRKKQLIQELGAQEAVAETTDMWSYIAAQSYLTTHFITSAWLYNHYMLSTNELDACHTGKNIDTEIEKINNDFGIIDNKIYGMVPDNVSNMVSCFSKLAMADKHLGCFGHTLQLCIRSVFKDNSLITRVIASAKRLVKHFTFLEIPFLSIWWRREFQFFKSCRIQISPRHQMPGFSISRMNFGVLSSPYCYV